MAAGIPSQLYPLALLCTGTTLALYGQIITNLSATDPRAQVIAWTKYAVNLLICVAMLARPAKAKKESAGGYQSAPWSGTWQQSEGLAIACGVLDVVSYGLNCIGFPKCGTALSMVVFAACGQIFTAMTRRLLLGRHMSTQQTAAVGVVTIGLVLRAWNPALLPSQGMGAGTGSLLSKLLNLDFGQDTEVAVGTLYIAASAAGYSLLGVLYEKLMCVPGNHLSHAKINLRMSSIGVVVLTVYQLVYTWPRRQAMVLNLMAANQLDPTRVIVMHAAFGAMFTVHSFVQGRVLEASGALTVGITNALRASSVSVTSHMLFCKPGGKLYQCLTPQSGASAVVITLGAMLWATARPAPATEPKLQPTEAAEDGSSSRQKEE